MTAMSLRVLICPMGHHPASIFLPPSQAAVLKPDDGSSICVYACVYMCAYVCQCICMCLCMLVFASVYDVSLSLPLALWVSNTPEPSLFFLNLACYPLRRPPCSFYPCLLPTT